MNNLASTALKHAAPVVAGLVAAANLLLLIYFPSSPWAWGAIIFSIVAGVAHYYRAETFYRRTATGSLITAGAITSLPSLKAAFQYEGNFAFLASEGSSSALAILFVAVALACLILDFVKSHEKSSGLIWTIPLLILLAVVGGCLVVRAPTTSDTRLVTKSVTGSAIGQINNPTNSPIHNSGTVTYNNSGIDEPTLNRIMDLMEENSRLKLGESDRDRIRSKVGDALSRARNLPDPKWQEAIEEARRSGDPIQLQAMLSGLAQQKKQEVSRKTDEYLELCLEVAAVAFSRADYREATHYLESALEYDPSSADALILLGNIHVMQGHLEEASRNYRKGLDTAPSGSILRASLLANLASTMNMHGDPTSAQDYATQMLELGKSIKNEDVIADARTSLGQACLELGRLRDAEQHFQAALTHHHKRSVSTLMVLDYNGLGVLYTRQNRLKEARQMYENAVKTAKLFGADDSLMRINLAQACLSQGDGTRADELLAEGFDSFEKYGMQHQVALALLELSDTYDSQGVKDKAESFQRRGEELALKIGRPEIILENRMERASSLLLEGKNEAAEKALIEVIRLAARQNLSDHQAALQAKSNLAIAARRLGKPEAAKTYLLEVAEQSQRSNLLELQASAESNIGLLALDEGNFEAAEAAFAKALELAESLGSEHMQAMCLYNLGAVAGQRADLSGVRRNWTRALELFRVTGDIDRIRQLEGVLKEIDDSKNGAESTLDTNR